MADYCDQDIIQGLPQPLPPKIQQQGPGGDGDGDDGENDAQSAKQAACLACRNIKVKCIRDVGAILCRRCLRKGDECVIPEFRLGRRKGVPNKRKGLDKAIHQLEQAVKEAAIDTLGLDPEDAVSRLRNVLAQAESSLLTDNAPLKRRKLVPDAASKPPASGPARPNTTSCVSIEVREDVRPTVVEHTENPLQLLAHATEHCLPLPSLGLPPTHTSREVQASSATQCRDGRHDEALRTFFGPRRIDLDVGPHLDPINLGLVTMPEAEELFNFFYRNLAHTRWGLDPVIHTAQFVRSRSAFLFTSVIAASARFMHTTAALSTRVAAHCKTLANHVIINRHRSVEIILAFMLNVPWLPGKHWVDDEGSSLIANALTIALDLELDKAITRSSETATSWSTRRLTRRDVIDETKALSLDGFAETDPASMLGRRLLRRRERVWLALFVLDKGFCMARERRSLFPVDTPLLEDCDGWHRSDILAPADSSLVSIAVVRRDLAHLITCIRERCDAYRPNMDNGKMVAETIRDMIEKFFQDWYATWTPVIADWKGNRLPPYVEILISHTRLSIYGLVMNHPTAPSEVHGFFHVGGLSACINVMRTAVQGEARLKSVPNNTVIMIAFAACLALRLSSSTGGGSTNNPSEPDSSLAHSVTNLVHQTADVFERIGSTPAHRQAASVLYAQHLRAMVGRYHPLPAAPNAATMQQQQQQQQPSPPRTSIIAKGQAERSWPEASNTATTIPLPLFADMSDPEFSEALKDVESELFAFQGENSSAEWWNNIDWFVWDDCFRPAA